MPVAHLHREFQHLNKLILQLGGQVEENLRQSVQALQQRDPVRPEELLDEDDLVDSLEVRVEEECLKILALYQPVATDLRYLVAVLKINGNLESIGDLTANLARHSIGWRKRPQLLIPEQIATLSDLSRDMLNKSLNALVERDVQLCREILQRDQQVDSLYMEVEQWFKEHTRRQPEETDTFLDIFLTAKDLERIADHTCHIAEDIIYLVTGEIVRHHQVESER